MDEAREVPVNFRQAAELAKYLEGEEISDAELDAGLDILDEALCAVLAR